VFMKILENNKLSYIENVMFWFWLHVSFIKGDKWAYISYNMNYMILLNGKSNISPFIRLSDFSYKIKCYVLYFYLSQKIEYSSEKHKK